MGDEFDKNKMHSSKKFIIILFKLRKKKIIEQKKRKRKRIYVFVLGQVIWLNPSSSMVAHDVLQNQYGV